MTEPYVIDLPSFVNDDRGGLDQLFDEKEKPFTLKRVYRIQLLKDTIRAFHGHRAEFKGLYVPHGIVKFIAIDMAYDSLAKPTVDNSYIFSYVLSQKKPQLLVIPPNFYNGFKALVDDSEVICFSSSSLEESKEDDFRVAWDKFGEDIWKVNPR